MIRNNFYCYMESRRQSERCNMANELSDFPRHLGDLIGLLKVWSMDNLHHNHLEFLLKYVFQGPIPGLLNQALWAQTQKSTL